MQQLVCANKSENENVSHLEGYIIYNFQILSFLYFMNTN